MADAKSYAARAAGPQPRPGAIYRAYPYDLRSLVDAMEEARLRSFNHGPQVLVVVTGRSSEVIRRYEHGQETWRKGAQTLHLE
jgi:hypothetical protein